MAVTKKEPDGEHPASHYLVVEDPEQPSTWHLRVKDANGKLDPRLLGACHAAPMSPQGFPGNKYEGPQKEEAIRKLKALYAEAKLEWSELDGKWLEIFRAGDYGEKGQYSRDDLDRIAANYDPTLHHAPMVVGHPASDAPAYGWVESLRRSGDTLEAQLGQVDGGFEDLLKQGRFKTRSVALYSDLGGRGPYLRHLGFLGAQPPEVKGLKSVFHDAEGQSIVEMEFHGPAAAGEEEMMTKEEFTSWFAEALEKLGLKKREEPPAKTFSEAEMKAAETAAAAKAQADAEKVFNENRQEAEAAAARKNQVREFIEKQKPLGKWIPAFDALGLREFAESLSAEPSIEFGEEGKKQKQSQYEVFQNFLAGLPKILEFGERQPPEGAGAKPATVDFREGGGITLDPHSVLLLGRTQELMSKDGKLAFEEAAAQARRELGDATQRA